jgi:hypothetical protein
VTSCRQKAADVCCRRALRLHVTHQSKICCNTDNEDPQVAMRRSASSIAGRATRIHTSRWMRLLFFCA